MIRCSLTRMTSDTPAATAPYARPLQDTVDVARITRAR